VDDKVLKEIMIWLVSIATTYLMAYLAIIIVRSIAPPKGKRLSRKSKKKKKKRKR